MNNYLKRQLKSSNYNLLPEELKKSIHDDFEAMSYLNIDNEEDHIKFFIIRNHIPEISFLIFNYELNEPLSKLLAIEVFKNRKKYPISTLIELIEAINVALNKMLPNHVKTKLAYPQSNDFNVYRQYDINKWVKTTRQIYDYLSQGYNLEQIHDVTINKWDPMEKRDYQQWLQFYKERVPEKYPKLAQNNLGMNTLVGNPIFPILSRQYLDNSQPKDTVDNSFAKDLPKPNDINNVRDTIEKQRSKLIGRLNSAEKLLATMDGQLFAGDDQEMMLQLLQDLKRKIMTANKKTVKSSLFEDYVYRTAYQLNNDGKTKAAGFFYKIAQLPDLSTMMESPTGDLGGEMPTAPTDTPAPEAAGGDAKTQTYDLLKEFFDNLKFGNSSDKDDTVEERKENKTSEIKSNLPIKVGAGYWTPFQSLAQAATEAAPENPVVPTAPVKQPVPTAETLEVEEPIEVDIPEDSSVLDEDNTDDVIDAALRGVTITDVINRLEMLVSVYNQREISRQLAILDIMMDKIGLASFFPGLGEAMSKALEANQYIGNRLEDIMTKLKGSITMPGAAQWLEIQPSNDPSTEKIKHRLEQKKLQEDHRRALRQQKEIARLEGKPVESITPGTAEELNKPVKVEQAPPIDVR